MLTDTERHPSSVSGLPAEEEISLLDLFIVVVSRRRLILWTVVGTTLAGLLIALLLPDRYTASTSIFRHNRAVPQDRP